MITGPSGAGKGTLIRELVEQAHRFRYCIRNDDVERATQALVALVETELQAQVPSSP